MTSTTTGSTTGRARTYFGWQPEKVAFLFGMSAQRAFLLVAAVLAAVWPLAVSRIGLAVVTWPVAAVLTGAAFARVAGRTSDEWATAALSYAGLRWRDQHKYLAGPYTPRTTDTGPDVEAGEGSVTDPAAGDGGGGRGSGLVRVDPVTGDLTTDPTDPGDGAGGGGARGRRRSLGRRLPVVDLPGVLAPVRFLGVPLPAGLPGVGQLAVAEHRLDRTYTAVARVTFPGIGLVDSTRRDARVGGWGALLAGLCTHGNPITRVQVLTRIGPASGADLRRWHTDHTHPGAPGAALDVTAGLLASAGAASSGRDTFLAFTLDARRASSAIKSAGGGAAGAATVLARQLRALHSHLAGADLTVHAWLGPRELAEVVRTAFDPHSARHLAEHRATHGPAGAGPVNGPVGREPGVSPALAGPAAAVAHPGSYQHDGAWSVTYWIAQWPRHHVPATALAPLLAESTHRRAVSLHLEPLGPREAEREVMRERTARSVAVRMRQRTGQVVPEHERAALEQAHAQDVERAAGHGLARFTGYITVTVTDPGQLDDACAELEADAAAARIELRRMWLTQDAGFAASALPLGFGLPRRRW
jgi:hypothetical protein